MPEFSRASERMLNECHSDLKKLFNEIVKNFDCTIICGYRNEAAQNEAYRKNLSKVKFPHSKHNSVPSMAVDVVPYPVDWKDLNRLCFFAGYVKAKAEDLGIKVRWGADWDNDTNLKEETFIDLPHWELI